VEAAVGAGTLAIAHVAIDLFGDFDAAVDLECFLDASASALLVARNRKSTGVACANRVGQAVRNRRSNSRSNLGDICGGIDDFAASGFSVANMNVTECWAGTYVITAARCRFGRTGSGTRFAGCRSALG